MIKDLNNLLSNDLVEYYDLYSIEEEAELEGISDAQMNEYVRQCEDYCGCEVVGVLHTKSGYEDDSYEVDGSFYSSDGKIYYGYGDIGKDFRFVEFDEDYAIDHIVEVM